MPDRRLTRLSALVARMEARELDGLLISSMPNIRYLTGFSGTSALLLVTANQPCLITDFRYKTQAGNEVGGIARVMIESQSLWSGLWRLIPEVFTARTIGFESAHLIHRDFERLQDAGKQWHWKPTVDIAEGLRAQKDADELILIEQAIAVATGALQSVLPLVRAGMTESQIAGMLESALRERGSESLPFPSIVASGTRSALPHARTSSRAVTNGDFLLLDFGSVVGGYCADITRTVVIGRCDTRQREVYEIVREANARSSASVRSGMSGREADAVARDFIAGAGYGEAFGHGLGHGIGLEVHEAPRLAMSAEGLLPPNAVVTIEPGVYIPEWGGVRIEDDVYLGGEGSRILTSFPRELLELS
ncbi:MAG: aminopeptidase P family protein [Gemmatimonadaceae bacterium]|nr:aminopeptidase P family protein [Gemmatimonadaceae bacterium]